MIRIVWLRNDLRIRDNKALYAACSDLISEVRVVFIATPKQWQKHHMSAYQSTFIYKNLIKVQQSLAQCGIPFVYHECNYFEDAIIWLKYYCNKEQVKELFYNCQYEINEHKRDQKLKKILMGHVVCKSFHDYTLLEPGSILNNNSEMYKIYTPFRKKVINTLKKSNVFSLPSPQRYYRNTITVKPIPKFDYPFNESSQEFPLGEESALNLLEIFCSTKITSYATQTNLPSLYSTSYLSPYLAVGIISPRQCLNTLLNHYPNLLENNIAVSWFNQLIWREFYNHTLAKYPFLCMGKPYIDWTNNIVWNTDEEHLIAWQNGYTGYPIIDAGMRQLNSTGWMHNRIRMITASFLVKDLLIDWRIGEKYFMLHLLDGNLALNNGNWQWISSTGNNSWPYFRSFNPTTQGKKIDPNGDFIRKWLPELNEVPSKYIHNPHDWAQHSKYKIDYPLPIIDHNEARQKMLMAFKKAKKCSKRIFST
ncbi:deoxyribodipyrimidine photo-lyase [Candidatus Ishikawella capsulata]|uniref:Deoxyribodipyrimidine photo-lyase n=1 Tax=Candidatus Ishikawaella capsulata Mpkobe TaxID=476281 RepID=C5WCP4_9ENTR|nr:deoxyribodipyrimidine photo-lyase [Candidatus Ishikawaella capsulata]BAH83100.1 deoxyribodipyrimidine photolyas [Candidatus Ishikawaella capsulata Mpkobe]